MDYAFIARPSALCEAFKGVNFMLELIPNQLGYPLLSLLILVPVAGSLILLFIRDAGLARIAGLAFSLVELALCVPLLVNFNPSLAHMQFGEVRPWIAAWNRSEERRVGKECRSRWSPYP